MDMSKLTPEMIEKAKEAKTPEELMKLAAQVGITLTAEGAEQAFAKLNSEGGLSDDDLEQVTGGLIKWPRKEIPLKEN